MEQYEINRIRTQLLNRREKIYRAISLPQSAEAFTNLLKEVDAALERMDKGIYGFCAVCNDPIEEDRLLVDPLMCVCLDHLDDHQKRTLESDLGLANQIQISMLPKNDLNLPGWEIFYHYQPAGAVSGDYCDIISLNDNQFFILGDVSGKGIAASMLMSQLHAMFHSMIPIGLGVAELVSHASKMLCETTMSSHYATLLCIKADDEGNIEYSNAGHFPPLAITGNQIQKLESTGMPIGLFPSAVYTVNNIKLNSGDTLLLYTDGLTEAFYNNEEYGIDRVSKVLFENRASNVREIVNALIADVDSFLAGSEKHDDTTIMVIRKK